MIYINKADECLLFDKFDIEKNYEFLFNAHRETYRITFNREIEKDFFMQELEYVKDKEVGVFLSDEPIGICDLQTRKAENGVKYGWVHFIYLVPKIRSTGLSSRLIDYAKEFCHNNNLTTLSLRTGERNIVAQKYYEREGFQREPLFDRGCEIGYTLKIK